MSFQYKKIVFGIVLVVAAISGILLFSSKAFAATPSITPGSDFVFINKSTITGTVVFTDANGVQTNASLTFYDQNVTDTTYNYGKITGLPATLCVNKINNPGINFFSPDFTASSLTGLLNIGYLVGVGSAATCTQPSVNLKVDVSNPNSAAVNDYTYTSPTSIDPVNGNGYPLNQGPFILAGGTNNIYAMLLGGASQCKYSWIIAVDPNDPTTGKLYDITPNKNQAGATAIDAGNPDLGTVPGPTTTSNCYVIGSAKNVNIGGNAPVINPNPTCSNGFQNPPKCNACSDGTKKLPCAVPPPAATSCEAQDRWSLGWLICSVLRYVDDTVSFIDKQINAQLCFPSGASTSAGKASCAGQNLLTPESKVSWDSLKNIATAVLVIVLLVMVISQAFGGGAFDAYTVRKLLPRLVIAAIAMQVSWYLAKWMIDLVNDIGVGLSGLMLDPFTNNGANPITLQSLLGAGGGTIFSVVAISAAVGGAIMIFASLALAVPVILGVITAILILVLRKVLILLCVLTMPIALVAWVLPGTQKYWKLWWETFSKMLIMFPMIVALIAAGKIFANAAGSKGGTNMSFTIFILVLIGYFGPYFILPKTFKWGGSALGAMGGAINNLGQNAGGRPKAFFKNRQEDLSAERKRKSAERVLSKEGFNYKAPWRLPIDKTRSGQWDPTRGLPGSRRRARAVGAYEAAGLGVEDEEIKAEVAGIEGSIRAMSRGDAIDHLETEFAGANSSKRQAIMTKLGQLQAGDSLTSIRDSLAAGGEGEQWNRAVQRNYDSFKGTSPHLASGLSSDQITARSTMSQAQDAGTYANQPDAFLAGMSGDGWHHFYSADPAAAEARYQRISNSGQAYAANLSPETQRRENHRTMIAADNITQGWTDQAGHPQQINNGSYDQYVTQRYGGNWQAVSHHDLLDIHQLHQGAAVGTPQSQLHQNADQELRRRGLIP